MQKLKVLVGCETSGVVREAFRALGHEAYSCDILDSVSPSDWHIKGDVLEVMQDNWDLCIFHPPCTYLSVSGIHWNNRGRGWEKTDSAIEFVQKLMNFQGFWAIENPVSIISSRIRKPDQTLQPFEYGHPHSKKTCLWLNGLPKLVPTKRVYGRMVEHNGKMVERFENQTDSGQNVLGPSKDRWKKRSVTYEGVARAMAKQWGEFVCSQKFGSSC